MSLSDVWVIDATMSDDWLAFVPVEGHDTDEPEFLVGLTFIGDRPPSGRVVGVIHEDGDEACRAWMDAHRELIAPLFERKDVADA